MNSYAAVYTPATITVPATERKSAHISSLFLLGAALTHSLISFTACFLLLFLRVGPVLFSVSFLALCSVFSFSLFSFSQFRSAICFTGVVTAKYLRLHYGNSQRNTEIHPFGIMSTSNVPLNN